MSLEFAGTILPSFHFISPICRDSIPMAFWSNRKHLLYHFVGTYVQIKGEAGKLDGSPANMDQPVIVNRCVCIFHELVMLIGFFA